MPDKIDNEALALKVREEAIVLAWKAYEETVGKP